MHNRASDLVGMLQRLFDRFTNDTIRVISNTYIRCTMKYAVQARAPWKLLCRRGFIIVQVSELTVSESCDTRKCSPK